MKIIRSIAGLKRRFKTPVLTMGMFDGVHLAHQLIIKEAVHQAKILKGKSMVLTFTPHPLKVFKRYPVNTLITTLEHRIDLIKDLNVDVCLLIDFNKKTSHLTAENFVKRILVDAIGVNYVIVGKGFRFGKDRKGSVSLLKELSKIYNFKTRQIDTVKIGAHPVSSTAIRSFIQRGKIAEVNKFLGRKFSISGIVKKGDRRGRILGYPTANIEPEQEIVPARGVYVVLVKLGNKTFPGMLNIGARPTFGSKKISPDVIEVHLFNFNRNIYSKALKIFFIQRIRPEKQFNSTSALLEQIKKDRIKAKKILASASSSNIYPTTK